MHAFNAVGASSASPVLQLIPNADGFRVQVRFRVPAICRPTCAVRADLRTLTAHRALGTRSALALPGGRLVLFYLTVDKDQLLRTPFATVRLNRIANVQLRVWLHTRAGPRLVVRDGRIAVSIGRIEPGALPGLAGVL